MSQTTGRYPTDVIISSDPAEARRIQDDLEAQLRHHHYADHEVFGIKLAVEEALVNAIKHGNRMDPARRVRVAYRVSTQRFDILIADEGPGFDPADVPDPTAAENLERPSGRGLMLMRHYMTEVIFDEPGNAVRMWKLRNGTK